MHLSQITKPFLLFVLLFSSFFGWGQTAPSVGDGSEGNPYQIATADHFKWIALNVNNGTVDDKHFKQTADIDFGGDNLTPIGVSEYSNPFSGNYDGNYFTIQNLGVNESVKYVGIFGFVKNGTIKNLKIRSATVTVTTASPALYVQAGILIGKMKTSDDSIVDISNIVIEGSFLTVSEKSSGYGGLIGMAAKVYIEYCSADVIVDVTTTGDGYVGGLIGFLGNGSLKYSFSEGSITSNDKRIGGLVGFASNYGGGSIIEECYSIARVKGKHETGGLVGTMDSAQLDNCFSSGLVEENGTANPYIGSFFGRSDYSSISRSYATGTLSSTSSNGGGFGGRQSNTNSTYGDLYYDPVATNQTVALSNNNGILNTDVSAKTTAQMKIQSTFSGFDFTNVWAIDPSGIINDGYPYLRKTLNIFAQSPELSISSSDSQINQSDTPTITFTVSKDVSTFTDSDISLTGGGSLSSLSAVTSSTYTAIFTPPTNFTGTVTITVNAGTVVDDAANLNTQTSTLVLNIDTIAPTISTLSHTHEDAVVRDVNTVPFFVTFTEPMASSPEISIGTLLTNATMTVSPSTNSQTWTYNWDVPSDLIDLVVSATVSATDLFGNYYGGSESLSLQIDNVSPTITLTENDADDILLVGESVIFTASVTETVSGVPSMTIVTTAGTTNDVLTAAGSNWTYSYTAPSNYSGVVSFTVSLLDIAGNISTATKTLTVDSITASITLITSPNSNGKYTDDDANPANSDTLSITLTFSEVVVVSSGVNIPVLELTSLPSQFAFYAGGSGTQTLTFSYRVLDGDEVADLSVASVLLRGATIKDVAGNPADLSLVALNANNDNLSDEKNIEIRAKDPSFINLTAVNNNVMGLYGVTDSNTVTYTFTSDIPLLSSSVSMTFGGFSTQPTLTQSNTGNTYTLSFAVLNTMPEGALNLTLFATDTHSSTLVPEENRSADYLQSAFNQTLIIDRTAPIITPTALSSPENSIIGPRVLANEVVFNYTLTGGVDAAKFTINPTTGVLSFVNAPDFEAPADTDADNVYDIEVRVTDIVGLTATQTIAVTVTDVSDTFGVDLTALDAQTSEDGGTASVNVKLFTQPTATVRLALQSSDASEGSLSTSSLEFTTANWNVDQNVQITGVDDSEIDGDVSYLFQVASVVSEDINYNALVADGLGLTNIDNEIDTDGDGFFDYQDAFPANPLEWADTDGDGIGNNADLDDDGDGFSDLIEIECGSNSLDNSEVPLDSDGDGVLDCQDTDDDNDGIPDSQDNCPFVANASQADADLDGIGDACDPDDDNDGTLDTQDAFPLDPTENIDTDGDGLGNNADLDDDGDGQSDIHENQCFSNSLDAQSLALDTDSDNIPDCVDPDSDNDGVLDTEDLFPLDAAEWSDNDGDGIGNNADADDDNDGFSDIDELSCNSDPLNASSKPSDIDNDGIADCIDTDMDGDGVLNSEDVFPTDPNEWSDFDGDGLGDNFDVDDDNDGYLDTNDAFPFNASEWVDLDQDGLGDNEDRDDNADGFDDEVVLASGVITPNTNGLESSWKIINIERYPNARVRVYSTNGLEVYNAVNYRNDWAGTFKKSNKMLPAGSYYYIVDLNDGERPMTGWLFLSY